MSGFLPAPIDPPASNGRWNICNQFTQFGVSAAVFTTGLAGRVCDIGGAAVNGVSSLLIGAGLQGMVYSLFDPVAETVHKVSQAVFGIFPLFVATQVWENSENPLVQAASVTAISVMLGAQGVIIARRLIDNGYVIRTRGQELLSRTAQSTARTFSAIFLSIRARRIGKGVGCVGCALVAALVDDEVMRATFSFFAVYYACNMGGEVAEGLFHRKVELLQGLKDAAERVLQEAEQLQRNTTPERMQRSVAAEKLRKLKFRADCINTLFVVVLIPFVFIPLNSNAHSNGRRIQLPVAAVVVGGAEGVIEALYKRKFTESSVNRIPELRKPSLENHTGYERWRGIWLAMEGIAMFWFYGWQVGWDLSDQFQRTAISVFFASWAFTVGPLCHLADRWNETDNLMEPETFGARLKDRAICYLIDPRIGGIPPPYWFFVLTNALELNDVALADQSPLHKALTMISWASYGHAMGLEVYADLTSRQLGWLKRLFMINAMITWRRQLNGDLS